MNCCDKLKTRELIAQVTGEEEMSRLANRGKATFYIGFDPTADSLHVRHFMTLCLMKRLQDAGNEPIALVGSGTGMIGDSSDRTDMRSMMTVDQIGKNCESFKRQISRFIEFGEGKVRMVSNADWLRSLDYIEFIRGIGPHFSVSDTFRAECYRDRMEKGLPFPELNCMLMQTFDFYRLFQRYDCNMQFGDDDQWSDMLTGTELIRHKLGEDTRAMTITLLLNSGGKEMGKAVGGVVWLDPSKASPFTFYQYWRNIDDQDVLRYLRMLTFLSLLQTGEMDRWEGAKLNEAKGTLAYELTTLMYGEREAKKTRGGAQAFFAGGGASAHVPTAGLTDEDFSENKTGILTLLVKSGLTASHSEARRNIQQGDVSLDGESVRDIATSYDADFFAGEGRLLKRGKKNFVKLVRA